MYVCDMDHLCITLMSMGHLLPSVKMCEDVEGTKRCRSFPPFGSGRYCGQGDKTGELISLIKKVIVQTEYFGVLVPQDRGFRQRIPELLGFAPV